MSPGAASSRLTVGYVLRGLLDANIRACDALRMPLVRRGWRRCALTDFSTRILPSLLKPGLTVLDAGGGKWPRISVDVKRDLQLKVTGLDLSADELRAAPVGAYDDLIVGDVSVTPLPRRYDLVVSQTLLEHVRDVERTIRNMAGALRPGGTMAHVLPSGRAPFALLNRLLGNRLGKKLLYTAFPAARKEAGFEAFYDRCTPAALTRICRQAGLVDVEITPYYATDYFRICTPLYLLELARQQSLAALGAVPLCELFAITAKKK
jgi:2-polyprenyl-6-hydroxyphenyl methylase/3-demethylubiquinone-9 3-methyltransferase